MKALEAATLAGERLSAQVSDDSNVVGVALVRAGKGFGLRLSVLEANADLPKVIDGIDVSIEVVPRARARARNGTRRKPAIPA